MRIKQTLITVLLAIIILLNFPTCNKIENLTKSSTALIVVIITGKDLEGSDSSTTIFSDVLKNESIFNDTATATLTAQLLDPEQSTGTFYQDIVVDRIDVTYTRSDISDAQEGIDIPFAFSQNVYARVAINENLELPFILVQHTAKLESPLVELINVSQEKILKMEAHCTFYGKDVAGNRIAPVTASVSVWFANFSDEN